MTATQTIAAITEAALIVGRPYFFLATQFFIVIVHTGGWVASLLMSKLQRVRFGEFLHLKKAITEEQLISALRVHQNLIHPLRGKMIGQTIVKLGYAHSDKIESKANEYHSIETIEAKVETHQLDRQKRIKDAGQFIP